MNVNLGRPAGALPSVHRTCHSPEGMLENYKMHENILRKISETHCEQNMSQSSQLGVVYFVDFECFDYYCQQLSVSPWSFLWVPLSYESALVWPQALVQTSIEDEGRVL